jgi:hypothetical protein
VSYVIAAQVTTSSVLDSALSQVILQLNEYVSC